MAPASRAAAEQGHHKLSGKSEHNQKRAVQTILRRCIDLPDNTANPLAALGENLIGHNLRANAQPITGRGLYYRPQPWIGTCNHVGRQRAGYDGGCILPEFVGLNDDAGTRSSQFAWNDHQYYIAAAQRHSLQSYAASIQLSMASLSGCCARSSPSRRIAASTCRSRKSGTQCCTGRKPCARKRFRRALMRSRAVFGFDFRALAGIVGLVVLVTCYAK